MSTIKKVPDRDEIAAALTTGYRLPVVTANGWADFLTGLPWRYIHPVVRIAINAGHTHPALVLATAIAASSDEQFAAAGRAHLDRQELP